MEEWYRAEIKQYRMRVQTYAHAQSRTALIT